MITNYSSHWPFIPIPVHPPENPNESWTGWGPYGPI